MPTVMRTASWHEVVSLFPAESDALRNTKGWANRYRAPDRDYRKCRVTLQSWTHEEISALMDDMSLIQPRMTEDLVNGTNNALLPPRLDGLPMVMVKFGNRYGMIDGKHRANKWKQIPGNYAALVIHA